MRRRGWIALGAAAALLAAGPVAAYAYTQAGAVDVSSPEGYFTFCADRQRDVAGISAADLAGEHNGGLSYQIENVAYPNTTPLVTSLPATHPFVLSKSGIGYSDAGTPASGDDVRRVIVTSYVEYTDATAAMPSQIRCKMRTQESLNKPISDKQRFDDGDASGVPWGFGPGTASGLPSSTVPSVSRTCEQVQTDLVDKVWDGIVADGLDGDAPFKVGDNVVIDPDEYSMTGSQWTTAWQGTVLGTDGLLHIGSRALDSNTGVANPIGDRVSGAYYCTFVAPEYLRAVLLGDLTAPTGSHG